MKVLVPETSDFVLVPPTHVPWAAQFPELTPSSF